MSEPDARPTSVIENEKKLDESKKEGARSRDMQSECALVKYDSNLVMGK